MAGLLGSDTNFAAVRRTAPFGRAEGTANLGSDPKNPFWFLCGWLGGPQHYTERFGHPKLRLRHMPFVIGILERDQWLACMDQAMGETGVDEALRARLRDSFFQTADWMRNTPA